MKPILGHFLPSLVLSGLAGTGIQAKDLQPSSILANGYRDQQPLLPPGSLAPHLAASNASNFYPLLPPAIPLAVRSPYLSAWLATGAEGGNGGYLAGQWAQFWPIQFPANPHKYRLGWAGLIRVNGQTYEFMGQPGQDSGHQLPRAIQRGFRYTSTRSIFEFEAAGVRFLVTFLSPLEAGDLLRLSLPFSYLAVEIIPQTAKSQDEVVVYTDIQADWASGDHTVNATWSVDQSGQTISYQVGRKDPLVFSEEREYAEWGQAIYATQKIDGLSTGSGPAAALRSQFISQGQLDGTQDTEFRQIDDRPAGFGFAVPLKAEGGAAVFTIGHVRDPYLQTIERVPGEVRGTLVPRWGYWRSEFNATQDAVEFFVKDYSSAVKVADELDRKIEIDARRLGGDDYVSIATLSARQAICALEITVGKDSKGNFNRSDVSAFSKEISSNGDMSTVDVIFPQFPALIYLDPTLLRYILDPIFKYSESGLYPNRWTVHDLGRYPNATGHNDGKDEPMPVEEAGNMLIMALAYYQITKDLDWLKEHFPIMRQWASFLIDDGLIPAEQLSTDDFAGKLANQTDLALKAIVGIGAVSEIARASGFDKESGVLRKVAEDYAEKWIGYALDKSKSHTKLAYQDEDSWGTLYNLFADRILNLRLVPNSIYEMQDRFYPTVANEFGVPLDHRHTWAKTDWEMFAAGAATTTQTRDMFTSKLVKFLKANRVNAAFPDLYETDTADFPGRSNSSTWRIEFINRPVVGGHFSILALDRLNHANGVNKFPFRDGKPKSGSSRSVQKKFAMLDILIVGLVMVVLA